MSGTYSCPSCGHRSTRTTDSRRSDSPIPNVRRRRACPACEQRFTTREVLDDTDFSAFVDLSPVPIASRGAVRQLIRSLAARPGPSNPTGRLLGEKGERDER